MKSTSLSWWSLCLVLKACLLLQPHLRVTSFLLLPLWQRQGRLVSEELPRVIDRHFHSQHNQYKALHGDCKQYKEDPSLANFVFTQRTQLRKGTLGKERQAKLDALGFVWDAHEQSFHIMICKLKEYKAQHGDCNVPSGYEKDPKLANFVTTQRTKERSGIVKEGPRIELDAVGFDWDGANVTRERFAQSWDIMLQQLHDYKEEYGDCDVPSYFKENPSLAIWVSTQRGNRADLTQAHRSSLDDLGFTREEADKKKNEQRWNNRFAELVKYQTKLW